MCRDASLASRRESSKTEREREIDRVRKRRRESLELWKMTFDPGVAGGMGGRGGGALARFLLLDQTDALQI